MTILNLTVGYKKSNFRVLIDNFNLCRGKILGILGTNGTGKSTFYKTLIGEIEPLAGSIPEVIKENIAIVSDQINLPNDCKVKTIMNLINRDSLNAVRQSYPSIYSIIESQLYKRVDSLSSGQRRVLQIFLMLASNKSIIIMDEACAYLDLKNKQLVFDAINCVAKKGGTILYTSHEMDDFASFDSEVYIFNNGRLSAFTGEISPESLKKELISFV